MADKNLKGPRADGQNPYQIWTIQPPPATRFYQNPDGTIGLYFEKSRAHEMVQWAVDNVHYFEAFLASAEANGFEQEYGEKKEPTQPSNPKPEPPKSSQIGNLNRTPTAPGSMPRAAQNPLNSIAPNSGGPTIPKRVMKDAMGRPFDLASDPGFIMHQRQVASLGGKVPTAKPTPPPQTEPEPEGDTSDTTPPTSMGHVHPLDMPPPAPIPMIRPNAGPLAEEAPLTPDNTGTNLLKNEP